MLKTRLLLFFAMFSALFVFAQVAQRDKPSANAQVSSSAPVDNAAELQALQSDVERMRSLILQMQNNMAFVGTTTAPLYHQFELEISMWQLQLNEMDRRIAALQKSAK